ncbi:hypothetical protein HDU77_009906, partial [Chytriomyces hyalinus]
AYDIVVICDDSGSMNTKSTAGLTVSNPFAPMPTRWDELKETVAIVTDIACALDDDGIDIYFLNRAPLSSITSVEQLEQAFADAPRGYTPTARVLRQVLNDRRQKKESEGAKKLLVLIATDGAPTDDSGDDDRDGLKRVLTDERPKKVPVVFLPCTDDDEEVGYLNEWDTSIADVDVVDDFYTERRQIKAVQGPQFPFSRGDWVCKMLLGPVDPEMDALDELFNKSWLPTATLLRGLRYADKYQQQLGIEKAQAREALRLEAFKHLVERHELKLRKLEAYDIVMICVLFFHFFQKVSSAE